MPQKVKHYLGHFLWKEKLSMITFKILFNKNEFSQFSTIKKNLNKEIF